MFFFKELCVIDGLWFLVAERVVMYKVGGGGAEMIEHPLPKHENIPFTFYRICDHDLMSTVGIPSVAGFICKF